MVEVCTRGRRCVRGRLGLVLCLVMCGLPPVAHAADEQAGEIIAAIKQWRERFTTLEVEYDIASRAALEARFPELKQVPDLLDDWGHRHVLRWAAFGAVSTDVTTRERGRNLSREIYGITPQFTYSARALSGERGTELWERIDTQLRQPNQNLSSMVQLPLLGLWESQQGRWLDEVLTSDVLEITWSGPAEWNGNTCQTCLIEHPPEVPGWDLQLWFDPVHGWLPARATPLRGGQSWELEVQEFREVMPGWWFPFRGEAGTRDADDNWSQWRMRRIEPNKALEPESFVPPAPTMGTWVTEPGKMPRVHGRSEPNPATPLTRLLTDFPPRALRDLPPRIWAPAVFVLGLVALGVRAWWIGKRA